MASYTTNRGKNIKVEDNMDVNSRLTPVIPDLDRDLDDLFNILQTVNRQLIQLTRAHHDAGVLPLEESRKPSLVFNTLLELLDNEHNEPHISAVPFEFIFLVGFILGIISRGPLEAVMMMVARLIMS
ncbi:hypothetical protein FPRO03_12975 [Fusarium proliferatum]|uniref:Uncharacterized protein n=1 Tax=Gibberella intermedia TaxID=948311 RepID=A0A365N594_GIBIN|nr:hypothetical protein FPRO03_12975 [Fusarium proliferatum]RBA15926.1 hypothetical protein FPRO05_12147 [Fusarium proliferatum]